MEIKRTVNGEELTFELTEEEKMQTYDEVDNNFKTMDVINKLDSMDDEDDNPFGVRHSEYDDYVCSILDKYKRLYGDADYGSWSDCLDSAIEYVGSFDDFMLEHIKCILATKYSVRIEVGTEPVTDESGKALYSYTSAKKMCKDWVETLEEDAADKWSKEIDYIKAFLKINA